MSKATKVVPIRDMSILDEVKEVFYQTTGLALSFHYPDKDEYDFFPKQERNAFCKAVQSTPEGLKACLESDCKALDRALETKEYCIYTCHAGLLNAVIPLVYKGEQIGEIFTGQIITKKLGGEELEAIYDRLEPLGIDRDELKKELSRVKVIDEETFQQGIRLLNFMANHIIAVEDEMYLQSELHQREREILTYENEQMQLKNDLQELSIVVLQDMVEQQSKDPGSKRTKEQKTVPITRAQEFIRLNYNQPLTLNEVSAAVYLSPHYFSTLFKETTGYNFTTYLNTIRIQEGQRLLRETTLPIKQVVEMVGFEDYNYFNKVFKRIAEITPATYRENFRKRTKRTKKNVYGK